MNRKLAQAAVIVLVIFAVPAYWLFAMIQDKPHAPQAQSGFMDLTGWNFSKDGSVELNGQWEFYRNELLTPKDLERDGSAQVRVSQPSLVEIPGKWNEYLSGSGESAAVGFGTYRLRIRLAESEQQVYGIHTNNIRTANRIFLNGQEVGASGLPGKSAKESKSGNIPYASFASVSGSQVDVLVQVANYSYASGGMIYAIEFGDYASIVSGRELKLFADFMTIAGFAIPAAYFLFLYRMRRNEPSLLYMCLFCVSALFYVLTQGEKLIGMVLPGLSYDAVLRLQMVSSTAIHFALLSYVSVSVKNVINPKYLKVAQAAIVILLISSATIPPVVFSKAEIFFFAYGFVNISYVLYVLTKGIRQRNEDALLILLSMQSIFFVVIAKIMNVLGYLENQLIVPIELFIFVMAQALLLAKRFARSFEEVDQLSKRLLTLDGLKDEFMATTSHELRTPLHGMINIAQSLLEGAAGTANEKQGKHLAMIVTAGKQLSFLINDILDFTRLKGGEIKLHVRAVDGRAVAESVAEVIKHMLRGKDIRLVLSWPEGLPLLQSDEERLRQVLYNLLGNAAKFTAKGEIRIRARTEGGFVRITVSDTGRGIQPEEIPYLFQAYEQFGEPDTGEFHGTGLGLNIAKKLVELHGGRIWAESEFGAGSQFHFTIPAAASSVKNDSSAQAESDQSFPVESGRTSRESLAKGPVSRYTVAIVDDDPVNLQVLINLLTLEGHAVLAFDNGKDALEEVIYNPNIDLVITDWMMPEMSGLELCRLIRKKFLLSEMPVLLLTARSGSEDIRTGFDAGINDFLSKPVDSEELKARVRTLLELRQSVRSVVETEMAFLQAQIKPHFLYNALNSIIAICPVNPLQAMDLLIELSQYLRGSFEFHNRDRLITLDKEMGLVRSYLALEQVRFGERLKVDIQENGSMNMLIPPLTIQPIVENAVNHGVMKKPDGGTVQLRILETDGAVRIEVQDDGEGIPPDKLAVLLADKPTGRVGLKNIHWRLSRLFGSGLQVESEREKGTSVSFSVPLVRPQEEFNDEDG
ncbi:ATP-binding protein [Cohnella boryungensis]|uniref:histidine kinase n=1 Tax=Cohnella boryungensis TaxID=768479 RepID=A0ABV8SDA3_9BACL